MLPEERPFRMFPTVRELGDMLAPQPGETITGPMPVPYDEDFPTEEQLDS